MDLEADFVTTAREVISQLRGRGKPTRVHNYDGRTVEGWTIGQNSYSTDRRVGTPDWEENWGQGFTVMTPDASFFEVGFYATESRAGVDRTEYVRPIPISNFVGTSGKPFSKWKSELERLPYK